MWRVSPHVEASCPLIDTFASVKPHELRSLFHLRLRPIFGGMGSYPRREKAEQKARERADTVPALDCQSCGALTPSERFRYYPIRSSATPATSGIRRAVVDWCRERFSSPAAYA